MTKENNIDGVITVSQESSGTTQQQQQQQQQQQPSTTKPRRKRKWDVPDESLLVSSNGLAIHVQPPILPQQVAAVVQKLNQPKLQEELVIAREIIINDADPSVRYKLTKRQTQEEIQRSTGAIVITRGKYRPPNAVPDGEKPLYLHISAGAQLKETAERVLAVDRAAAIVEEMLKQGSQPLSTCVYLGFEADPSLNIASRIRGPNDQYINHIKNATGAAVILRGRGSGFPVSTLGEEPIHLFLSSNNAKSLEDARLLAENLLDTISRESGATRVPSSKVYGAVPPPQQLVIGVHSPGMETNPNCGSPVSLPCSAATSVVAPVVPLPLSNGQMALPGGLLSYSHAQSTALPNCQPLLASCTSYGGYGGIYPQATPLQQVSQALKYSSPIISTVAHTVSSTSGMPESYCETEKRPTHKRKFQEAPATVTAPALLPQGSSIKDSRNCLSVMEEKNVTVLRHSKKVDNPSLDEAISPSLKSLMPPPPPKSTSMPPGSRSMPPPPPPPKFPSSCSVTKANDKDDRSKKLNLAAFPDTLVKLMEYGEDDDDAEESEQESFKGNPNRLAASVPF